MKIRGVITALVTPFTKDEKVDEVKLRDLVEMQINEGISGLLPMGSTGESPTMDPKEHIEVIKIVIDQAKKRVPVIAGTGSNCTKEAIAMTREAKECGADISLQVSPYYVKPNQEGFYRHFMSIADSVDLPMIVYNIPGRSAKNIENPTMLKLAEHKNIIGVKEASGDINQITDLMAKKPADFALYSGDDNLAYLVGALGGDGVISVISNLIPKKMENFMQMIFSDDMKSAKEFHFEHLDLFKSMFMDTNPIPVKYAAYKMGLCDNVYRLPLCQLSKELQSSMDSILKKYKLV